MNKEDIANLGSHVRTVHFSVLMASIGLLIVIYGYNNISVHRAMDELELVKNHLARANENQGTSLSDVKEQWSQVIDSLAVTNIQAFSKTGEIQLDKLSLSLSTVASVENLENCNNWNRIERFDAEPFTNALNQQRVKFVNCEWLGENLLVVQRYTYEASEGHVYHVSDKSPMVHALSDGLIPGMASNASDLGNCGNWSNINRSDFRPISNLLTSVSFPVACTWLGEDELFIAKIQPTIGLSLVTPEAAVPITESNAKSLISASRQIANNNLRDCAGTAPVQLTAFQQQLAQTVPDNEAKFCVWIGANSLLLFSVDWEKGKPIIHPELRSRIGMKFGDAFPYLAEVVGDLSELDNPGMFDSFETDPPEISSKESIDSIQTQLDKKRIEIGQATIAGIPIKQEILLYCTPPLLVILQLYFLLHHRNLVNQLSGRKLVYPWLGFYDDTPSICVSGLTLCILPSLSMLLFMLAEFGIAQWILALLLLTSIILASLTARSLREFWKLPNEEPTG